MKLLPSALVLCMALVPYSVYADTSASDVHIPASISRVEVFGDWQFKQRRGQYRLVVAHYCSPEHCFDRPYLQWIESLTGTDGRHGSSEIASSIRLADLGDFAVIQQVELSSSAAAPNRFEVLAINTYTGESTTFCINPGAPGKYRATRESCPSAE